ncbi:12184_t:CDS:2 [Funneliformis geosporum]|uniref:13013_t:CDS:1 n=1 Tax=Funneliformis geosporum TaxID=1117311 RepID=A0A9W4WRZ7_9GLOM|nr:13013_t:CDS:2 [Funneliformis geosporum]CAI2187182.1 12184_t:CDS:2 [Funneliformis geosporum]
MKIVPEARNTIMRFMISKEGRNHKKPYSELSKKTGYSSKQIYHIWNDQLNPTLDRNPLSSEEKEYINQWVEVNKTENNKIHWMNCQKDMKRDFQKLRSTNIIKNAWYAKQKRKPDEEGENGTSPSTQDTISTFNNDIRTITQTGPTNVLTSTATHHYIPPTLPTIEPSFQPDPPKFIMKPIF